MTVAESVNKEVVWILVDKLVPSLENPQEMDAGKFNQLVKSIRENGFDENMIVVPMEGAGTWKIVSGEHRWLAAKTLGMLEVPCVVQDFDDDKRLIELVKRNALKGKISPQKFVKLYEQVLLKHSKEEIAELMALEEDELKKLIGEVRSQLPDKMKKDFDKSKDEIKTIDDLSLILNRLFAQYGDTLDQNYMIFDYGGQKHLWVRCDAELWKIVDDIREQMDDNDEDANEVFKKILRQSVSENKGI